MAQNRNLRQLAMNNTVLEIFIIIWISKRKGMYQAAQSQCVNKDQEWAPVRVLSPSFAAANLVITPVIFESSINLKEEGVS